MWWSAVALALANDGPPPRLFAEQVGHDVELRLHLAEEGEPGMRNALDLLRDGVVIVEDRSFDEAEAVSSGWHCGGGDSVWYGDTGLIRCDDMPDLCEVCDDDGEVICPKGGCFQDYDFLVIDACIDEGTYEYGVRQHGSDWVADDVSITVEASDEACTLPDTGADPDATKSCGCSGLPGALPGYGLGLGMLLIGVVAWPRRRRG